MTSTSDDGLTVVNRDNHVALRLHATSTELQITKDDAARIARDIDAAVHGQDRPSLITVRFSDQYAIQVPTDVARRLAIELGHAATARARKTDKERAYINDRVALSRARTRPTATGIAARMLTDGHDPARVLEALWATAFSRGWKAGVADATED